jgi:hypothetical protein
LGAKYPRRAILNIRATCILFAAVLLLAGCTSNTKFTVFSSKEGGFSVELPIHPTERTSQMESPWGMLTEHDYFSIYDGVSYVVGYIQLPNDLYEELKKRPDTFSDLDISGLASHSKGRILAERGVRAEGRKNYGKEVLIALPDGKHNLVSRVFWAEKTLYLIHTIIPTKPSYNQDLYSSKFLNSLHIVGSSE